MTAPHAAQVLPDALVHVRPGDRGLGGQLREQEPVVLEAPDRLPELPPLGDVASGVDSQTMPAAWSIAAITWPVAT